MAYNIPKLKPKEIETLQVDAALRMIGTLASIMVDINTELGCAIGELGQARVKVEKLKADKQTVVELNRALKVIVQVA